jgi:hypothetical protein
MLIKIRFLFIEMDKKAVAVVVAVPVVVVEYLIIHFVNNKLY